MIGATIEIHPVVSTLIALGVLVLGVGYLVGQFRSGGSKAMQEALVGAQAELAICSQARERLDTEIREYRDRVQRLAGKLDQLEAENDKLNKLVMGEIVPPALQQAMEATAAAAVTQLLSAFDERFAGLIQPLHEVAQGITRLLTERDPAT